MKKFVIIYLMLIISYSINAQTGSTFTCLEQADAEKILGQPVKLVETNSVKKDNIIQHRCTYTAKETDSKTGRLGNIYYMVEEYSSAEAAHESLENIISQNRDMAGWNRISSVGYEGLVHTDKTNFQLVMVRRENKMIRLKVNKITSFTASIETLQFIGQKIASTL